MDVVVAAWCGAGSPASASSVVGVCARCGSQACVVAVRAVVSKNFTGYDGWATPGCGGLCPACAWAHTSAVLREVAHQVSQVGPHLAALQREDLAEVLAKGALSPGCALVVPLRPGRKHVIAAARWGQVATEAGAMPWRGADARALGAVVRLRAAGFGPRMIAAPAPAYPVLRALPAHQVPVVLGDWAALAPWRAGGAWLELALHATTGVSR